MRLLSYVLAICLLGAARLSLASGIHFERFQVDFTNPADVAAKTTWLGSDPDNVPPAGASESDKKAGSQDPWFETKPLAVGLSWRPVYVVHTQVILVDQGEKTVLDNREVYVRYSPDLKHWSSWQFLERREAARVPGKQTPEPSFAGTVRVPFGERAKYERLLSEYSRQDVPWASDEEAAVRWILQQQPDFFVQQLPFIGYLQFRYENRFQRDVRLQSFQADVTYCVGGKHMPPKDPEAEKKRFVQPWSFQAEEAAPKATEPSGVSFGIPNDFSGRLSEEQERGVPEALHGAFLVEPLEEITASGLAEKLKSRRQLAEETQDGTRYVALKDFRCVHFPNGVSGMMIVIERYRVEAK